LIFTATRLEAWGGELTLLYSSLYVQAWSIFEGFVRNLVCAIQVGVIITRAWELQEIFKSIGKGSSYGKATTHHEKLWPKVEGGGGGGCPVLTFAIKPENFVDDGEAAYLALKKNVEADKAAKKAAKKAGLLKEDEEDEE
jgi:hypothetical protein